ncbi:MAG: type II toxin-antitoxin system prevent-host-death family antitoxin [Coriobacteriia bacterium]|nr:type II toxin-antitoxin system prevent-host-death family antitoxin [Coriobacteriia bacterium]
MPNIKNVSSLRNYQQVLADVQTGQPVFLTKNGTGRYAVIEIDDYNMLIEKSWQRLFNDLRHSKDRGDSEGWITQEEYDQRMDALTSQ